MYSKQDQSGVLILLSLIMMAVILTGALILATLAIREARVSSLSDKGQVALFASESIVEDIAYQILHLGIEPLTLDGTAGAFTNGAQWEVGVKTQTNEFVFDYIPEDGHETIDLYLKDANNFAAGINGVNFNWSSGSNLQIFVYEWDGGAMVGPKESNYPCAGTRCSGNLSLITTRAYSIEVYASGTAVTDLIASVNPASNLVDIPIKVQVESEYKGARQAVELTLGVLPPWDLPIPETPATEPGCPNGIQEGDEVCDSSEPIPCEITEGSSGHKLCNENCNGYTECVPTPICTPGESEQCFADGGYEGTKICSADGLGYEDCVPTPICTPGGAVTCQEDGHSGTQLCSADGLSLGDCVLDPYCGDGKINGSEVCDISLPSEDCFTLLGDNGKKSCEDGCGSTGQCVAYTYEFLVIAGTGVAGYSGDSGLAINANLNYPEDVFPDDNGNIYIADSSNHRVRKIDSTGIITTYAGTGSTDSLENWGGLATEARIATPYAVFFHDNLLYVSPRYINTSCG